MYKIQKPPASGSFTNPMTNAWVGCCGHIKTTTAQLAYIPAHTYACTQSVQSIRSTRAQGKQLHDALMLTLCGMYLTLAGAICSQKLYMSAGQAGSLAVPAQQAITPSVALVQPMVLLRSEAIGSQTAKQGAYVILSRGACRCNPCAHAECTSEWLNL